MKTTTLCAGSLIHSSRTMGPAAVGADLRTHVVARRRALLVGREHYSYDRSDRYHGVCQIAAPDRPVTVSGGGRRGRGLRSSWPVRILMPRSASAAITSRRCAGAAIATGLIVALGGCVSYPPGRDFPKSQSEAVRLGPDSFLVSRFADALRTPSSAYGFRILFGGVDGLLLRLELIERARQSLGPPYYIFRYDASGGVSDNALVR